MVNGWSIRVNKSQLESTRVNTSQYYQTRVSKRERRTHWISSCITTGTSRHFYLYFPPLCTLFSCSCIFSFIISQPSIRVCIDFLLWTLSCITGNFIRCFQHCAHSLLFYSFSSSSFSFPQDKSKVGSIPIYCACLDSE